MVAENTAADETAKCPVLHAYEYQDPGPGIKPVLLAWCPWCGKLHKHGVPPGHRSAHCLPNSGSPFLKAGYVLESAGTVDRPRDARPHRGLMEGFHAANLRAAPEMRRALLKSWFPDGFHSGGTVFSSGSFLSDLPGEGLVVVGLDRAWWTYRPGPIDGLKTKVLEGHGLDALARHVFGMQSEAVSERIGMVISGRIPSEQIESPDVPTGHDPQTT